MRDDEPVTRQDFARVVLEAVRRTPRLWSRTRGVPMGWVLIGADGEPRWESHRGALGDGYMDDRGTPSMIGSAVRARLGDHRCVALIYGNRWMNWRLPLMSRNDTAVCVHALHRSGDRLAIQLPFVRSWHPIRRIRFTPEADRVVADVAGDAGA